MHTVFARQTAASIGWKTNGFQYEVGFANLAVGLAAIYAGSSAQREAWIAASLAGGVFPAVRRAQPHRRDRSRQELSPGQHGDPVQRSRRADLALRAARRDGGDPAVGRALGFARHPLYRGSGMNASRLLTRMRKYP
jgi:hypothetical protein